MWEKGKEIIRQSRQGNPCCVIVKLMARSKKKKPFRGFALIEIMVAFAILALIASAFFVGFTQIQKARDAKRKADLEKIKTALYDYYFDANCFPKEEDFPGCGEDFGADGTPYLTDFPCDPNGEPYKYMVTKKGGGKCSQWFRVFANLEVTTDPIIDRIHCRQGCGPDDRHCDYNYGVASTNVVIYQNCGDNYVCNPGGVCERFEDPWASQCPVLFGDDSTCGGGEPCKDSDNRCQNASGKQTPEE